MRWLTLPFRFTTTANFYEQLNLWLSTVFYTTLPAANFEIREEQIYSSFRIVNALKEKGALMAEAGSGTGKTFAYLLPALCYARLAGQPALIACSSAALQEQLVSPQGDIQTLANLLNLEIKAELAKDPGNYVCSVYADMAKFSLPRHPQRRTLLNWLAATKTGDRAELGEIDDRLWQEVAFNEFLDCRHCRRRGYCHHARARQRLWEVQDFVICSHTVFFRDLWTRRRRMQKQTRMFTLVQSKLPYLPHYSAVIIDEAHLIEDPALKNLGVRLNLTTITRIVQVFSTFPLASAGLLRALEKLGAAGANWFAAIKQSVRPSPETQVCVGPCAEGKTEVLLTVLEKAMDEMAMYQQYDTTAYIQDLERFWEGLNSWLQDEDSIAWWDSVEENFWVLPRDFSGAMGRELLAQKKPVLFTSATLDAGDGFTYFKTLTGIEQTMTSKVTTSFPLAEQMSVYIPHDTQGMSKVQYCASLLRRNGGSALILCNTRQEVEQLRKGFQDQAFAFNLLWEGTGDSGWLVQKFRQDESSVLIGTRFWEGIDIPGPSLTLIIVWSLPFPAHTPIFAAKLDAAAARNQDPYQTVELPAMGIKLRQGLGRLIRTKDDFGAAVILEGGHDRELRDKLVSLLPLGVRVAARPPAKWGRSHLESSPKAAGTR